MCDILLTSHNPASDASKSASHDEFTGKTTVTMHAIYQITQKSEQTSWKPHVHGYLQCATLTEPGKIDFLPAEEGS